MQIFVFQMLFMFDSLTSVKNEKEKSVMIFKKLSIDFHNILGFSWFTLN